MSQSICAIILAAGRGVRMNSKKAKVLHEAAGLALIEHALRAVEAARVDEARIVIGHSADEVQARVPSLKFSKLKVQFYLQKQQNGTADAVKAADPASIATDLVLIMNGDHPLITGQDLTAVIDSFQNNGGDLLLSSGMLKNPQGLGRIVRDRQDRIVQIVEQKDATVVQLEIREVNAGLYLIKTNVLNELLPQIDNRNAQREFYLTDLVKLALQSKFSVIGHRAHARVCRGVNNRAELALASQVLFARKRRELMDSGVTLIDPKTTFIDASVRIGRDTVVGPGVCIRGSTEIGEDCELEGFCRISDSLIEKKVRVRWGSVLEECIVRSEAVIGPYARLRPETEVGSEAHIGNFVELKKTKFGARSKANHLAYLGDADVGEDTNVGCGTITCNFAVNRKKHKTIIGNGVFIGSDTQLVAPVEVGDGAVIASGSTITKDVPSDSLALSRTPQVNKEGYAHKLKKKD